ncbi:MAG: hypothetical protein GY787_25715 [Alteromonadales bacterium]|nr:hypothetical protein [Alteromonadales bacterium]
MVTVAQLSTKQRDIDKLLCIGKTFAKNLSIIEQSWLHAIVDYCECVLEIIHTSVVTTQQNDILKNISVFFALAKKRLTASLHLFLSCYIQLFSAQVNLLRGNKETAHYFLFKAVSPHYEDLNKLPLVLKLKIICLADEFGEFWLSEKLLKLCILRNSFEKEIHHNIKRLVASAERSQMVGTLLSQLDSARGANQEDADFNSCQKC